MIRKFQKEILRISSFVETVPNSERKRVYFEAIHSKTKTFSPSSITAFALKSAGGINVADDAVAAKGTNVADYGTERLLSKGDKIDVYLAQQGAMNHAKIGTIMEEGGFQAIRAVREGNIHIVDEKIVSRPTLRLLDGIYEIGRILYPGKFNDVSELKNRTILSRAKFAELFVKIMNIPLKTPDYQHDIQDRADGKHKYGNFRDVDYTGNDYKFIETAVYRGLFYNIDKGIFYPDKPITRKEIAFILFVYFDLIDAKPVSIQDIKDSDPLFNQIQKVAGLGILKLDKDGKFLPDAPVSGKEAISAITLAREHTVKGSRL
jgi:iron complex transport system substrate-binding protein